MSEIALTNRSAPDTDTLCSLIAQLLDEGRAHGATAAEASIDTGSGLAVTVRLGEVETIEHHRDKVLGVTVYIGKQKGSASTSDLSERAIADTVQAACAIARYTQEDANAGLVEPELMAKTIPDLDLHHPWDLAPDEAIGLAETCETEARTLDARINNSEGATVNTHRGQHVYGNTTGFLGAWSWTGHSIECTVIAEDASGMQRDSWYSVARDPRELQSAGSVGRRAGQRTVRRLGAKRLSTRNVPVVFEAEVAKSLFAHFTSAISGGNLYRKSSFLLDHLGRQVFAPHIRIHEQPHLKKALGSAPFDNDGVATRARDIIKDGILQGYLLSAYSARKLGMQTTGNAGGVHNLTVDPGECDLPGILQMMDTGLLVTDLMGFGVNLVTGDYSRGATGFWVKRGTIQFPVEEITIAGNLRDMFLQLVEVGSDVDTRGNIRTGSVLIEHMTIAGE